MDYHMNKAIVTGQIATPMLLAKEKTGHHTALTLYRPDIILKDIFSICGLKAWTSQNIS